MALGFGMLPKTTTASKLLIASDTMEGVIILEMLVQGILAGKVTLAVVAPIWVDRFVMVIESELRFVSPVTGRTMMVVFGFFVLLQVWP